MRKTGRTTRQKSNCKSTRCQLVLVMEWPFIGHTPVTLRMSYRGDVWHDCSISVEPGVLPEEVLQQAADEMLDWHGSGQSVMGNESVGRSSSPSPSKPRRNCANCWPYQAITRFCFCRVVRLCNSRWRRRICSSDMLLPITSIPANGPRRPSRKPRPWARSTSSPQAKIRRNLPRC